MASGPSQEGWDCCGEASCAEAVQPQPGPIPSPPLVCVEVALEQVLPRPQECTEGLVRRLCADLLRAMEGAGQVPAEDLGVRGGGASARVTTSQAGGGAEKPQLPPLGLQNRPCCWHSVWLWGGPVYSHHRPPYALWWVELLAALGEVTVPSLLWGGGSQLLGGSGEDKAMTHVPEMERAGERKGAWGGVGCWHSVGRRGEE